VSPVVRAVINGESVEVAEGTRLVEYLAGRGVDARRLAVERNREVVPRPRHAEIVIADGDVFEVVHFVGGG
jgi:thiamine biosynthesis protein ThiS